MSGNISSPQDPKVSVPAVPRKGGDLNADQEKVNLGGKSGSSVINSPATPKLGGKGGAS